MEKADALVSLAGPVMNFLLAIVLTIIYCALYKFVDITIMSSQIMSIVITMIMYAIAINVGLGVFNLIPLPPLDGSKIILPLLPSKAKMWFKSNESIFYIILFT